MIRTTDVDGLVAEYLDDLERALADVSGTRRRELVGEISDHIEQARAELADGGTEAEVRTLLERLGDPAEIAADALDEQLASAPAAPRPARGWTERLALVLLPIGGVLLPLVGWLAGVVLLWSSERWTTREKLVGTFVVPGGYLPLFWVLFTGGGSSEGCLVDLDPETGAVIADSCAGAGDDATVLADVLTIAGLVVLVVAPLLTVIFLRRRLRDRVA